MPADFNHKRYLLPKLDNFKYRAIMKTLENSLAFDISDVAGFRHHVICHYYKYGLQPTLAAFNLKKSTFYDWRNAYEINKKRVIFLVPKSTTPSHVRRMHTDWRLVEFIKQMRKDYGNVGKHIIKPFLDAYATSLGTNTIGLSTIGKIIRRRHFTFEERIRVKRKNSFKKLRTRKSPRVATPGFIQMDSIVVYVNKERHLFMSVIDIYTKFALVKNVSTISSLNSRSVFMEFLTSNPTPVHTVQTDNGSEFLASFHQYLEEKNITHKFIYPNMPRINGVVERFNRTVQEECICRNDEIYYDIGAFDEKLVQYLHWYNFQRPHSSLGYLSPMMFIQTKIPKCG
jgi:transposase InsO family protein